MKNIKKISYLDIKNYLISNNIKPLSDLNDNDLFSSLNSINNANENELTFFNDTSQSNELLKTRAKACLIDKNNLKYLPNSVPSILVENTYEAFAILSNFFAVKTISNANISKYSSIHNNSYLKSNVQIDSFVEIGEDCRIEANVIIHSNCKIGPNVVIGSNSILGGVNVFMPKRISFSFLTAL